MRSGRPFKPWDSRPQVPARLAWVMEAFWELSSCRQIGMSIGPLPWTAVVEYARVNDVRPRERFLRLIRAMDGAFLETANKRGEKGPGGD